MKKKSPPEKKTKKNNQKSGRGYRCRYSIFLRLCAGEEIEPEELIKKSGVYGDNPQRLLNRFRNGQGVDLKTFKALANELRVEPTNLCYLREERAPDRESVVYKFAERINQLIQSEQIPEWDEKTGEKTNVVSYVWHMGDPILDRFRMSFEEEREAFFLLRDHFLSVVERPQDNGGPHRMMIGKMERGITSKDDILSDIEARASSSQSAFDVLKRQFECDQTEHIERIREMLPHRFEMYLTAVKADQAAWKRSRGESVNERTVIEVVNSDEYLRKIIFPTHQQDETFFQHYSRSRRLIERVMRIKDSQFRNWWPGFRDSNTDDLRNLVEAWKTESLDSPPDWQMMSIVLKRTLSRTRQAIIDFYPDVNFEYYHSKSKAT